MKKKIVQLNTLTIDEKNHALAELILTFSQNIIVDLDLALNERKQSKDDAPYIDMIVESFFSIQSFRILMKDGLISSASAILRIILEQVSITHLLSINKDAKKEFLRIKQEQYKYLSAPDDKKDSIKEEICEKNSIKDTQIKQYFDYGWCKQLGCTYNNLKSICKAAGTERIYWLVDKILNGFAHGQRSIYQLQRSGDDLDKEFIRQLYLSCFQLFFIHIHTIVNEFGKDVLSKEDDAIYMTSQCLMLDISTRVNEIELLYSFKNNYFETFGHDFYYEYFKRTVLLLDMTINKNEKYCLSQSYVRIARQIITLYIVKKTKCDYSTINGFNLANIIERFSIPDIDAISRQMEIPFPKLIEMIDIIDDNWILGTDEIDYAFTSSVNTLLVGIKDLFEDNGSL